MITVEEMTNIYDHYIDTKYDDIDLVVAKVSAIFIEHKTNDYAFGFPRLMSISNIITYKQTNYNLREQKIKELKMLMTIITDELAILSKIQYGIYNLCCNEEDFFNYLNNSVTLHINDIVAL